MASKKDNGNGGADSPPSEAASGIADAATQDANQAPVAAETPAPTDIQEQILAWMQTSIERDAQRDEVITALADRLNRFEEEKETMHARLHETGANRDADQDLSPKVGRDDLYEELGMLALHNLPEIPGMVRRWVRTSFSDMSADLRNSARKLNQGWVPVPKDQIPDGVTLPCMKVDGADVIAIPGMVLMMRPEAAQRRHTEITRRKTRQQYLAVKTELENSHDSSQSGLGRPQMARRSESEVSRARRIEPANDPDAL